MSRKIEMSVCLYNDGKFEVFIIDKESGAEICLPGNFTPSDEEKALLGEIAPPCVWTKYQQISDEDFEKEITE